MFNLQGSEIIFILLLALVVLGPEKLPGAIRRFTQTYSELRKMGSGFQTELKSALDEPMREMRETAGLIRESADPSKIVAEGDANSSLESERDAERALRAKQSAEGPLGDSAGDADGESVPDANTNEPGPVDEWADPVEVVEVTDGTTSDGTTSDGTTSDDMTSDVLTSDVLGEAASETAEPRADDDSLQERSA